MTDLLEGLMYFIAAGGGIYTIINVVNWVDEGTKNLPAPIANTS